MTEGPDTASGAPGGNGAAGRPDGADGPGTGDLAWLRREAGDVRLRPWRLTPERLAAYVAGVRALRRAGPAVEASDPGAALDPDRQPALRPWEGALPADVDPVDEVADALEARPPVAAALASAVPVRDFAAAHVKLQVCVRALALVAGDDARRWDAAGVGAWCAAQRPAPGAEADFAASLVTTAAGWADVNAAFAGV